jgi:hypothetical protein
MNYVADLLGVRDLDPLLPEFDFFPFPNYCVNAVLGPRCAGDQVFAKEGQNALNLRKNLHINMAGIAHTDGAVHWWPGPDVAVRHDDLGLIMRLPSSKGAEGRAPLEPSYPTIDRATLSGLLEKDRFRANLGLQDEKAWDEWQANVPPQNEDGTNLGDCEGTQTAVSFMMTPSSNSQTPKGTPEFRIRTPLVAAGHASREEKGATKDASLLLEVDAYGIPSSILKKLDEAELETLERLWNQYEGDPIKQSVPKFEGIVTKSEKQFLRMSYVLRPFRRPKVMDVKIGLRTYLATDCDNVKLRPDFLNRMLKEYPNEVTDKDREAKGVTKLRWMQIRDAQTTISSLGFRIDGVAGSRTPKEEWKLDDVHSREEVCTALRRFVVAAADDDGQSAGDDTPSMLAAKLVAKMREIQERFKASQFVQRHECIGSSLLLVADAFGNTGIFWIDFGKTRLLPEGCPISHDTVWVEGTHDDGIFLGMDNLLKSLEDVASEGAPEPPCPSSSPIQDLHVEDPSADTPTNSRKMMGCCGY